MIKPANINLASRRVLLVIAVLSLYSQPTRTSLSTSPSTDSLPTSESCKEKLEQSAIEMLRGSLTDTSPQIAKKIKREFDASFPSSWVDEVEVLKLIACAPGWGQIDERIAAISNACRNRIIRTESIRGYAVLLIMVLLELLPEQEETDGTELLEMIQNSAVGYALTQAAEILETVGNQPHEKSVNEHEILKTALLEGVQAIYNALPTGKETATLNSLCTKVLENTGDIISNVVRTLNLSAKPFSKLAPSEQDELKRAINLFSLYYGLSYYANMMVEILEQTDLNTWSRGFQKNFVHPLMVALHPLKRALVAHCSKFATNLGDAKKTFEDLNNLCTELKGDSLKLPAPQAWTMWINEAKANSLQDGRVMSRSR